MRELYEKYRVKRKGLRTVIEELKTKDAGKKRRSEKM